MRNTDSYIVWDKLEELLKCFYAESNRKAFQSLPIQTKEESTGITTIPHIICKCGWKHTQLPLIVLRSKLLVQPNMLVMSFLLQNLHLCTMISLEFKDKL